MVHCRSCRCASHLVTTSNNAILDRNDVLRQSLRQVEGH